MTSMQSQKQTKKQCNINEANFQYAYVPPKSKCHRTKYPPSYFYLFFIVVTISACFKAHVRLVIHVGQSIIINLNFKVCIYFGFNYQ